MKIQVEKNSDHCFTLGELDCGDIFRYPDSGKEAVYMLTYVPSKIHSLNPDKVFIVQLSCGWIYEQVKTTKIVPLDGECLIKGDMKKEDV